MSSTVAEASAAERAPSRESRLRGWLHLDGVEHDRFTGPIAVAVVSAVGFLIVQPDVGDLQAALARAFAARQGVGLGYWFQWFGGGATPGNYSVITPSLSGWIGAPLVGAVATVAIAVLSAFAASGTRHPTAATWVAVITSGLSLWSGRVPFALGTAVAVGAYLAWRHQRRPLAWALTVLACLCSPVTGAFLAFLMAGAFLVEPAARRLLWPVVAVAGVTLLTIAVFFGNPGPQPYPFVSASLAGFFAIFLLLARPAPAVRINLWLTMLAALVFVVVPTGMGSNWNRMVSIWLPPLVAATATASRRRWVFALLPAIILGGTFTVADLVRSTDPAARASYYNPLIRQLDDVHGLANYRVEVVQSIHIHTAAFALIGHAALAGGFETQEQSKLNAILASPSLDATSYKLWLDNNAVGYVAFNTSAKDDGPEYKLVQSGRLPYLTRVSHDAEWTLYRVRYPNPVVPLPARLLDATQAQLTIRIPCACRIPLRVRYSSFLDLRSPSGTIEGDVTDDGTGWSVVRTPSPGTYVLSGSVTRPLR